MDTCRFWLQSAIRMALIIHETETCLEELVAAGHDQRAIELYLDLEYMEQILKFSLSKLACCEQAMKGYTHVA